MPFRYAISAYHLLLLVTKKFSSKKLEIISLILLLVSAISAKHTVPLYRSRVNRWKELKERSITHTCVCEYNNNINEIN